jgi:uncharacterized protein
MKSAIILHGKPDKEEYYNPQFPSSSNYHWIPWLQKQLIINEIKADTPEVPHAFEPQYPLWKKEFERFEVTPQTILVGHSCGGGFLVRWLSENKNIKAGKVILIAPSLDVERAWSTDFFEFEIDPDLAKRTSSVTIFNSDTDADSIQKAVKILREKITGIKYREFANYGHFTHEDIPVEFPELLEECLK